MKKQLADPFKPTTPQNAEYFINCVKDPTVKKYLRQNISEEKWKYWPPSGLFRNMNHFLNDAFEWSLSPQLYRFWSAISDHFVHGSGLKTYNDFKHLDESIKK